MKTLTPSSKEHKRSREPRVKNISLEEIDFIVDMHALYSRMPCGARAGFEWWLHHETKLFTHKLDGTIYFSLLGTPPLSTPDAQCLKKP